MKFKHFFVLAALFAISALLTACAGAAGVQVDKRSNDTSATQVQAAGAAVTDDAAGAKSSETPEPVEAGETPEVKPAATEDNGGAATPVVPAPGAAGDHEFVGTVEAIDGAQWTIDGQVFVVTNATEFKDTLGVGDLAKVHIVVNPDGTITVTEIAAAPANATAGWDDNGQDPATHDVNDDNGQDAATHDANDDNGQDAANHDTNDDKGGSGGGHGGDDNKDDKGGSGGSGH